MIIRVVDTVTVVDIYNIIYNVWDQQEQRIDSK